MTQPQGKGSAPEGVGETDHVRPNNVGLAELFLPGRTASDYPDFDTDEANAIVSALEEKRKQLEEQIANYIRERQADYIAYELELRRDHHRRHEATSQVPGNGDGAESSHPMGDVVATITEKEEELVEHGMASPPLPPSDDSKESLAQKENEAASKPEYGDRDRSPPRERDQHLAGLFVPSFLPLIDSEHHLPDSNATESVLPLPPVPITEKKVRRLSQQTPPLKRAVTDSAVKRPPLSARKSSIKQTTGAYKKRVSIQIADDVVLPSEDPIGNASPVAEALQSASPSSRQTAASHTRPSIVHAEDTRPIMVQSTTTVTTTARATEDDISPTQISSSTSTRSPPPAKLDIERRHRPSPGVTLTYGSFTGVEVSEEAASLAAQSQLPASSYVGSLEGAAKGASWMETNALALAAAREEKEREQREKEERIKEAEEEVNAEDDGDGEEHGMMVGEMDGV